jgi:hypothetical protein
MPPAAPSLAQQPGSDIAQPEFAISFPKTTSAMSRTGL